MRKAHLLAHLRSTRVRAALGLGVVVALGTTGTFAFWTDSVTVNGQTLTSGTIDLQVGATAAGAGNSFTTTTLNPLTNMVPGDSVAQVLVLKNHGDVPMKWTMTGGLLNADDAALFNGVTPGTGLLLTITDGAPTGTAPSVTCTAGSNSYVSSVQLTNVPSTSLIPTRQTAIPGNDQFKTLCVSIKLSSTAPTTLSGGKKATPTFAFTGTSDIS